MKFSAQEEINNAEFISPKESFGQHLEVQRETLK